MRHTERQSPIVCSTLCCIQMADLLKLHIFFFHSQILQQMQELLYIQKNGLH